MACKDVINFDCPTILGESFFGLKFEFDPLEITELEVQFFDKYNNPVEQLFYTVANGKLAKPAANIWEMQPLIPTVDPGLYKYHVRVVFDGETEKETIITGTKKFEL